jgi:hypothetical protein
MTIAVCLEKWLHLVLVVLLLGSVLASYALTSAALRGAKPQASLVWRMSQWSDRLSFLWMALLALSGTLLIYPKGFTYHTPWIDAAYVFLLLAACLVVALLNLKWAEPDAEFGCAQRVGMHLCYGTLSLVLMVIAYEAVSKHTFLRI